MSDSREWAKIAAAVVLPNVGGIWGSRITRDNLKPWYAALNKPKWNPPNFIFAPVWTGIYCSIGYASYLVYRDVVASATGWDQRAQLALALYANQMAWNWAWTPIFFKYHSLKWVCIAIVARMHREQCQVLYNSDYHADTGTDVVICQWHHFRVWPRSACWRYRQLPVVAHSITSIRSLDGFLHRMSRGWVSPHSSTTQFINWMGATMAPDREQQ